jgi:PleD family two-component response regulator
MTPVAWQLAEGELRILVLAHPPTVPSPVGEALAPHGRFAVTSSATPAEAGERLAVSSWDCVVTTAPESVAALRSRAPDVPVIVLGDARAAVPAAHDDREAAPDDLVRRLGDGEVLARAIRHAVERRRTQAALAQSALRDPLTGLPNRTLLADRIGNAFSRLPRSGRKLAVLCLALDGFKLVNDSLGHAAGDVLLA